MDLSRDGVRLGTQGQTLGKLIAGLISEASGLLHTERFRRDSLTSDLVIEEFQVRPRVMKD
jgi:CRISPR/Cas system-associated endonuclease Cas1